MQNNTKNILFVIPPVTPANEKIKKNLASYKEIPLGILSLSTYLEKNSTKDIRIEVLDLNVVETTNYKKVVCDTLERFQPYLVGISGLFTSMFNTLNEFSAYIKEKSPDVLLVTGGNISTNCYEQLFRYNKDIDGACYSEGEKPLLHLVEADDPFEVLESHPSWITENSLKRGKQVTPTFIQNLDDIPPLDFSFVNLSEYDSRCRNNNPISHTEEHALRLPFVTTRGCPFDCVFCAASSLSGNKVRFMSAERVISDIKRAKDKYKMTKLVINDDQALINRERIKKILMAVEDLDLVVEFPSGLNVKFIDEEIAGLLKRAGLEVANLAIESGSEYVLKEIIGKPLKLDDIRPAVEALRKNGLLVHAFFIFGFPTEREEDREATVRLIKEIGFDWSNIYAAAPIRGSRLYKICVEKGYIVNDNDLLQANIYESMIRTSEVDPAVITKFIYHVNLDVNFVNNYRMKINDYEIAKGYFDNVAINHPTHAFAHYFLAQALEKLNAPKSLIEKHMDNFYDIVNSDLGWEEYAREFKLIL